MVSLEFVRNVEVMYVPDTSTGRRRMKDVRLKKSVSRFTQKLWTTTTSCDAKFAIVGRKMMLRKGRFA